MLETRVSQSSFRLLMLTQLLMALPVAAAYRCGCDDEGTMWSLEAIFRCQRTSDLLIAVAYFSIPIELLWFVSCSNVPFKWVLFQFIAFIVLCGLTHLINGLSFVYGSHPSELLMVSLTVSKILTTLVSCTAVSLMTLIPLLLKAKVRELMLRRKAQELRREVGIIMRQREAALHVRMLTREIRRSLDRHTILYTTLIELSRTLGLRNCAVWMPDDGSIMSKTMNLTHELRSRRGLAGGTPATVSIPMDDPDVVETLGGPEGRGIGGIGEEEERPILGPAAAIRMPMLRASNFKGGPPDVIPACYAILVLVLPGRLRQRARVWTAQEIEIVKVVADQVAVAMSHASLLEESQLMREKLEEQNLALQVARRSAMMASEARSSFQKVMSEGMRRSMHNILGLLSILQEEEEEQGFTDDQRLIVDSMARTCNDLSVLMMEGSMETDGRLSVLERKPFRLHAVIKQVACLVKCQCNSRGFELCIDVDGSLPDHVVGDERRVVQVIMHTVTNLLARGSSFGGGYAKLKIFKVNENWGTGDRKGMRTEWMPSSNSGDVYIKFELEIKDDRETQGVNFGSDAQPSEGVEKGLDLGLGFSICRRIVQMMEGDFWIMPELGAGLILRFQVRPSDPLTDLVLHERVDSLLWGTAVLLADGNDTNRAVTQKPLKKLGCRVFTVGSGFECLNTISSSRRSSFKFVILELQLPGLDGFEVATRIRKFWSRSSLLILALTVVSEHASKDRCMEIGMNGFITKPITLQGMAKELKRVMLQANT
ncbi:hypothetical protein SAY87_011882 [Trapa incisa]|uniref:Ethylene receptor n=1 Tax=Trapa incisa TaxID=236973 RepID=A0AAN7JJC3_9MYRT|nr:hypothetical protein SAY87_011882 [Trapa incisa]